MTQGDRLRALLYAIQNRKETLERRIAEQRQPKDENSMNELDCFLYGQKKQMEDELEVLKRWLK